MSKMMEDKGTSVGIEHIKELCDFAINNISKHHKNLLVTKKVILINGDGRKGCPESGPYDCIHVGAAAEQLYIFFGIIYKTSSININSYFKFSF